ncbi:hypothetical protein ABZ071_29705, partial [Micromonospora fulviviridis]
MSAPPLTPERRAVLSRRSLWLAYATAGYNLIEGMVAIAAGAAASSTALLGFGLDSLVEVSSAAVVIWQFRSRVPEDRERLALRLRGRRVTGSRHWAMARCVDQCECSNRDRWQL